MCAHTHTSVNIKYLQKGAGNEREFLVDRYVPLVTHIYFFKVDFISSKVEGTPNHTVIHLKP